MYDQLTHRMGDYAIDYTGPADAYIDLGLAPAGGEYSYHGASFACATTLNQAQTSRRQSTSSTQSSIRSPPPSLYRDSSSSPSSIFDELSTPSFGPLEYACMPEQFVSPQSCDQKACGSVGSATVAAPHLAYSNILHPENGANGSQLIPDINAWLQDQGHYAFTEQHAPIASTSTAQPPQSCASYGLPPAAFMQPQPAAMPDLQHPRPKRAFTPAWQEQTEFDLAEFVKSSPRSAVAPSPIRNATQQVYSFYGAPSHVETVGQEGFEDMDEDDAMDEDEDEDEEDWDLEDDAELDQSIMDAEPCALLPHDCHATGPSNATLGMGSGSRMGRGFSTQPLNPQSLLFQPVADYVRCPDLAPAYVPTFAQEYAFTYTPTC
ncbi:hypothetical protein EIP86_005493 [Pleurotus ostreatoroseus]|nr:hypothetical protein EIP86_005493 [Pleurotus ostreatoroseus]